MTRPRLRFRRDDGTEYPAWEDLCLSEIVEPNNIPVENPGSNYVKLAIRSHCKGTFHKPVNSEDEGLDVDTMYLVEAYNLIVNITFAWEHAIAITKPEDAGTYVSHRFPQYKFVNGNLPSFYEYVIKNPRMKYEMGLCSPGGAGRNRVLSLKDFMKIQVVRPCPEEQQKIAAFLSDLDAVISASEAEVAALEQQKKGAMQKIFSQEVRFRRDDGTKYPEWKATKFGSLLSEFREKTTVENEDTLLSCAISGMFLNTELFGHQRGKSNIGYLKIRYGTLILSAQNLHLGNANVNLRFEHGIISPAYKTYEIKNCNLFFMAQWIKRPETNKFFYDATTVGASQCRRNIDWNRLYEQYVQFPCPEEQQKIADFLSSFDAAIDLARQELEKWKLLKKGLMQQMFV